MSIKKVLEILNNVGNFGIDEAQLDDNLLDLGMDSMMFIQVIVALEEVFACEIPDSKLVIAEMNTAQKIFDILKSLYDEKNS